MRTRLVCFSLLVLAALPAAPSRGPAAVYLPVIVSADAGGAACAAVPGASYQALTVPPPPSDRPAEAHADLNLALRGYSAASSYLGLVDINGGSDPAAPQLPGLFADRRTPVVPERLPGE